MAPTDPSPRTMKTTETSLEILELVQRLESPTLTQVAQELDLNKTSAYTHLVTLTEKGYLVKEDDTFRLGMRLLRLGIAARKRHPGSSIARSVVDQIANEANERASYIIEENGKGVYLYESMGNRGIPTGPEIGGRVPLHATASGKAVLAFAPDERRDEIISTLDLEPFTDNTITSVEEFRTELARVRENRFAINEQEDMSGVNAVAVPVRGVDDVVVGALSIAGPAHRMTSNQMKEEYAPLLLGYANEFELSLDHADGKTGFPYDEV